VDLPEEAGRLSERLQIRKARKKLIQSQDWLVLYRQFGAVRQFGTLEDLATTTRIELNVVAAVAIREENAAPPNKGSGSTKQEKYPNGSAKTSPSVAMLKSHGHAPDDGGGGGGGGGAGSSSLSDLTDFALLADFSDFPDFPDFADFPLLADFSDFDEPLAATKDVAVPTAAPPTLNAAPPPADGPAGIVSLELPLHAAASSVMDVTTTNENKKERCGLRGPPFLRTGKEFRSGGDEHGHSRREGEQRQPGISSTWVILPIPPATACGLTQDREANLTR